MTGQRLELDQLGEVLRTGDPTQCAGLHVAVLSPHLDDGLLSCGGLVSQIAAHCSVTVVTLFTEACPGPHSRAAQSFVRQAGWADRGAVETLAERRREDLRAPPLSAARTPCTSDTPSPYSAAATARWADARSGIWPSRLPLPDVPLGRHPRGRVSRGDDTLSAWPRRPGACCDSSRPRSCCVRSASGGT